MNSGKGRPKIVKKTDVRVWHGVLNSEDDVDLHFHCENTSVLIDLYDVAAAKGSNWPYIYIYIYIYVPETYVNHV